MHSSESVFHLFLKLIKIIPEAHISWFWITESSRYVIISLHVDCHLKRYTRLMNDILCTTNSTNEYLIIGMNTSYNWLRIKFNQIHAPMSIGLNGQIFQNLFRKAILEITSITQRFIYNTVSMLQSNLNSTVSQ